MRNPYEDRDQEAVAGVERVCEKGGDVACERAEETVDQDRAGERYGYEVRKHSYNGDLIEGGSDYG